MQEDSPLSARTALLGKDDPIMPGTHSKVLLVDDDPDVLRIIERVLARADYQVELAANGLEALERVERDCPDFIITDWEMPGLNGLELCTRLRQAALSHYVYMVVLTGKSEPEALVAAMEAGADDFIAKSTPAELLLAKLRAGQRVLTLERQLSHLARNDTLTGAATRRTLYEQFDKELARVRRHKLPLSCAMLDVDFFKRINDTHGHAAGDAVLKAVAGAIRESSRASDVVGRYGGEEFCIVLPETREAEAAVWAERLRRRVEALTMPGGGYAPRITASIGVAEMLDAMQSVDELIDHADQAMFVAKQTGRNRVVSFSSIDSGARHSLPSDADLEPLHTATAGEVMCGPVACLRRNESLRQAAGFFCRFRVNSVPVVDDSGRLAGILSEKDLLAEMMMPQGWQRRVSDVMKTSVVSYGEDTPILKIHEFLCRVTIRRVIVVRDGYPVGVISRGILLRWFHERVLAARRGGEMLCPAPAAGLAREELEARLDSLVAMAATLKERLTAEDRSTGPIVMHAAKQMQDVMDELISAELAADQAALPVGADAAATL